MPFWQRILITLVAIVVVSWGATLLFEMLVGFAVPRYVAGVIGGLVAVPVWEFLKRVGPRK